MPYLPRARKIKPVDELAPVIEALKKSGKTIVHAHGIFDLIHPAHVYHFERAKELGDVLVVSLVEDRFVRKGPGRPVFGEALRAEWLAALEIVDFVVFCGDVGPYHVIRALKPHFYVKGESCEPLLKDPQSGLSEDKRVCASVGTALRFTKELEIHSTPLFQKIQQFFD